MVQGADRRKPISLSHSNEVQSEKERDFANILSAIAKAQQQRQQLKHEFQLHNTFKYCLLEAGAETLELSLSYARQAISCLAIIKTGIVRLLPELETIVSVYPRKLTAAIAPEEDSKLAELKRELDLLRAQMQKMTSGSTTELQLSSLQTPTVKDGRPTTGEKQAPKPLPFDASMLITAKKSQKTPVKISDRSAPAKPGGHERQDSIQNVLQRALEEKFKNVRLAEKEDLESSFDSSSNWRSTPGSKQSDGQSNPWRATGKAIPLVKTEVENKTASKPRVPPRPKVARVQETKRKVLTEQNT
jgi:hypothetical protein